MRPGLILAVAAACVFGVSTPAMAAESTVDDDLSAAVDDSGVVMAEDIADRIVDRGDEYLFAQDPAVARAVATQDVVVTEALEVPAEEQPAVGETVLVQYADGFTVHQSLAAACTISSSAGTPYIASPRRAQATVTYQQTGCSGIDRAGGIMQIYFGFTWQTRGNVETSPIVNGSRYTWGPSISCPNSNSSPFRSGVTNRYTNGVGSQILSVSNQVTLSCGL
jgi:hypothetical protein